MVRGLDGYLNPSPILLACAVFKLHRASRKIPVVHSERETPLPIPNRAVKPFSADGTWGATPWESRSPPVLFRSPRPHGARAALFYGRRLESRSAGLCSGATRRRPPAVPVLPLETLAPRPIRLRAAIGRCFGQGFGTGPSVPRRSLSSRGSEGLRDGRPLLRMEPRELRRDRVFAPAGPLPPSAGPELVSTHSRPSWEGIPVGVERLVPGASRPSGDSSPRLTAEG
jgi:hypothetical protein